MAQIINGKQIACELEKELEERLEILYKNYKVKPGLAVVVVGNRNDSEVYVKMKRIKAETLGFNFQLHKFDISIKESELLSCINKLNENDSIHGIIVQLPLPEHINKKLVTSTICSNKDVDGFNELNMGKLALAGYKPNFIPCTPRGVWHMLKYLKIDVRGKHVVILGKSNTVGLPMAMLMMKKEATVSVCNADTPEQLEINIVKHADILISAVGKAHLVKAEWIKDGAIVIDIGINSIPFNNKAGYKLVGDVDYDHVKEKASMITPVPGGVGPMTVIMLMKATIESCERMCERMCANNK